MAEATGSLIGVWVVTLAILGFLGGTIFASVLRLAEGRRRFDELSLPRFGAVGAVGGLAGSLALAGMGDDSETRGLHPPPTTRLTPS